MAAFLTWLSDVWDSLLPWVIVDPWEVGVRVRCGKWVKEVGPGIHFTIPFFDKVETINPLPQWEPGPEQSVESSDHIPMVFVGAINYAVDDPIKLWTAVQDHDDSLATECAVILARWVNSHPYEDLNIDSIVSGCLQDVQSNGREWGCEILSLGFKSLSKHRVYRMLMS